MVQCSGPLLFGLFVTISSLFRLLSQLLKHDNHKCALHISDPFTRLFTQMQKFWPLAGQKWLLKSSFPAKSAIFLALAVQVYQSAFLSCCFLLSWSIHFVLTTSLEKYFISSYLTFIAHDATDPYANVFAVRHSEIDFVINAFHERWFFDHAL